jgi:hypothetical protein
VMQTGCNKTSCGPVIRYNALCRATALRQIPAPNPCAQLRIQHGLIAIRAQRGGRQLADPPVTANANAPKVATGPASATTAACPAISPTARGRGCSTISRIRAALTRTRPNRPTTMANSPSGEHIRNKKGWESTIPLGSVFDSGGMTHRFRWLGSACKLTVGCRVIRSIVGPEQSLALANVRASRRAGVACTRWAGTKWRTASAVAGHARTGARLRTETG